LEAKFVKALDKIEVRLQHNEAKIDTWSDIEYPRSMYVSDKYCDYDEFLKDFNGLIKEEAKNKIKKESDKNIDEILKQAEELKKNN
jgi:putative hydrolase of HD superfamily